MTPYVKDGYWYLYDKTAKEFVKSEYKAAGNAYACLLYTSADAWQEPERRIPKTVLSVEVGRCIYRGKQLALFLVGFS